MSQAQTQQQAQAPTQTGVKSLATQKRDGLRSMLEGLKPRMQGILPKHLTAERMVRLTLMAVAKTPKLLECTQASVAESVMVASQLGLDCGGVLGSAYLVPYGNKCQLIVGYRGMIDLARRSGQIESINVRAVFKDDEFNIEYGIDDVLTHRPSTTVPPAAGNLIGCYCVAKFVGGGRHVEYMSRVEIGAIRGRSKASGSGPWVTDYVEMAKKTVVRRAFKYWPMSTELAKALEDAAVESDTGASAVADIIDTTATETPDPDAPAPEQPPADAPGVSRAGQVLGKLQGVQPQEAQAPAPASDRGNHHPYQNLERFTEARDNAFQSRGFTPEQASATVGRWLQAYGFKDIVNVTVAQRIAFIDAINAGQYDNMKNVEPSPAPSAAPVAQPKPAPKPRKAAAPAQATLAPQAPDGLPDAEGGA